MRVKIDCPVLFVFLVQVFTDLHDAGIVVMQSIRAQIGYSAVGFSHESIDYQQRPSLVEQIRIGQAFDKFDAIQLFVKQL